MVRRMAPLAVLAAFAAGCSSDPGLMPEAPKVTGKVTFADGTPVRHVQLVLQPRGAGLAQVSPQLGADGEFSEKVHPGTYGFYFEVGNPKPSQRGAAEGAMKAIPAAYRNPAEENFVEVKAGEPLNVTLKR